MVFKALFGRAGNRDLVADLLNGLLELPSSEWIVSVEMLPSLGELEATDEELADPGPVRRGCAGAPLCSRDAVPQP